MVRNVCPRSTKLNGDFRSIEECEKESAPKEGFTHDGLPWVVG